MLAVEARFFFRASRAQSMAIYHYHTEMITRSQKAAGAKASGARGSTADDRRVSVRSIVAAAAYRAGDTLTLEWESNPFARYLLAVDSDKITVEQEEGKALDAIPRKPVTVFDFSKKPVSFSEVLAPDDAPAWARNRQTLWNTVENSEKRIDSQLARQIDAALPRELTLEQCKEAVRGFVAENFTSKGMVADVAFHDVEKDGGGHNPHVHILLTTRRIEGDGFAPKKCDDWRPKFAKVGGRVLLDESYLQPERESWAKHCNDTLANAGDAARIDYRSYAEQGIVDQKPTFHIGRNAWNAEKDGGHTLVGSLLRDVLKFNELRQKLKAWQKRMAAQPFYKLAFLKHAQQQLEESFMPSPVFAPVQAQARSPDSRISQTHSVYRIQDKEEDYSR